MPLLLEKLNTKLLLGILGGILVLGVILLLSLIHI